MYERARKITPFVYQERFAESMINYASARSPIIDRELCPIHRDVPPGRVKRRHIQTFKISVSKLDAVRRALIVCGELA